jgi:hypothetical protein
VTSACECFAGICDFWRHHMKPTVRSLGIHLPGKKVVLAACQSDPLGRVDIPSPLERYLNRCPDVRFDAISYIEDYSKYSVDSRPKGEESWPDRCDTPHFANLRRKPIICMLNTVCPSDPERFALRLLLQTFPARSWEDLRDRNGQVWPTFQRAACQAGRIPDRQEEATMGWRRPLR